MTVKRGEVVVEQVHAHDRAVAAEVVVGSGEAASNRLVPVGHRPVLGIDPLRVIRLGDFTTVKRGFEDPSTYTVRHNGQNVLMLQKLIHQQPAQ